MSEIIIPLRSNKASQSVSRQVKAGELRLLVPRVYTSNLTDAPEEIVRRNMYQMLAALYPGVVISHRSALEGAVPYHGVLYGTYPYPKTVKWPGVTIHLIKGPGPHTDDGRHIGGLAIASTSRALLENMQPRRTSSLVGARTWSKTEVEAYLAKLCNIRGVDEINRLRDEARRISGDLGMASEFKELNVLITNLLGTGKADALTSAAAVARARNMPYDTDRMDLFVQLAGVLRSEVFPQRKPVTQTRQAQRIQAFFEAYFSNYIEGTELEVGEAKAIVFDNKIPKSRPADAHDIRGTFQLINDQDEAKAVPGSFGELEIMLKARHQILMAGRPEKNPGRFKEVNNRAGATSFVVWELVRGTLKAAFDHWITLQAGVPRAIFAMAVLSEVHPFDDGNGRVSRLFMNAELSAAGLSRVIIPTVFRDDYIFALRAFSQTGKNEPLIRAILRAQEFTAAVKCDDFDLALAGFEKRNAFKDPGEARMIISPAAQ